ncbi:MAG: hypothetical protein VB049_11685 [Candidatus Pelethousia sp.]|nr:hypothetical protein [Candidatus Pelethousia sp.]
MPRIYSRNEAHEFDMNGVVFHNGAAALPADADVSYFTTVRGYAVDENKHFMTYADKMNAADLRELAVDLGCAITGKTKSEIVRLVEGAISAKFLGSLTVTSAAGTANGDTLITFTGSGSYKYKTGETTPYPLYLDDVSDWIDIESGEDITPAAGHAKITVVEVNEAGLVVKSGSATITVKT